MHLLYACFSLLAGPITSPSDSLRADSLVAPLRPSTYAYQLAATNRLLGLVSHPLLAFKGLLPGLLVRPGSADPNQMPILHWRGIASVFQNESQPTLWVDGLPTLGVEDHAADDWDTLSLYHNALVPGALGAGAGLGVLGIQTKRVRWGADGRAVRSFGVSVTGGLARPVLPRLLNADEFRELARLNLNLPFPQPLNDRGANTDWLSEVSRRPMVRQVGISATGGTRHLGYYASINYLSNPGVARRSDYERLSTRINTDGRWLEGRLRVSLDGLFTQAKRQAIHPFTFFHATIFPPTDPVRLPNGEYTENPGSFFQRNPVAAFNQLDTSRSAQTFTGQARVSYELLPGFRLQMRTGLTRQLTEFRMLNRATLRGILPYYSDQERQGTSTQTLRSTWFSGDYARLWSRAALRLEGGYGFIDRKTEQYGFWIPSLTLGIAQFDTVRLGSQTISAYGQAFYQLGKRFNLSGQVRRDGSSLFGLNRKWGWYGAGTAQFVLVNKPWRKLDLLTITVNWATNWNGDALRPNYTVATLTTTERHFDGRNWVPTYTLNQQDNANLGPERQRLAGVGLNFSAWRGRLSGNLTAYDRLTTNGIWRYRFNYGGLDNVGKFQTQVANGISIQNRGFDGQVQWEVVQRKKMGWTMTLTTNYNQNKVVSLEPELSSMDFYHTERTYGSLSKRYLEAYVRPGYPVGAFFGNIVKGKTSNSSIYADHIWEDSNQNGRQDLDENAYLGSMQPRWQGSWQHQFRLKHWQFQVIFTRQSGGKAIPLNQQLRSYRYEIPYWNQLREAFNNLNEKPVRSYSLVISPFVENASFTRLENLTLSYSLPLPRNQHLDLSLTGWNLKVWTKYRGIDPELNYRGFESLTYYPYSRSVQLGASWRF